MSDFEIAEKARSFSCSPYSHYTVGAALRTKSGKVYMGCNIENHGIQGLCAERTAFAKALSEGERDFESITVLGAPVGEKAIDECTPCGYCRQFMSEFVDKDFKVYTRQGDEVREYTINDLLPHSFIF
ncbi:MAG: cytidine deaminase [Clostridia bacterium]|nr:cytidine deaminase [Clostridia bacterium]